MKISRAVLRDIAGLRALGLTPRKIAGEIGANIDTIAVAISYLDQEGLPEEPEEQNAPAYDEAARLGESHALFGALSRVEFFDLFDLDINDIRAGYSASALYHVYLRFRLRALRRDFCEQAK
ncbi:hypothetical protein [Nonomuraea turcica]|uniref:hypothetical protein n=1 Tax=Nonomuraea sp. G32 TaxID=3067274 RepID=UPI00273CACDA|nr:hypothetical protein [Nonomuraea sp. G32]MDP4503793.1 hypothetical protein [Nonomuraea sp. G32]